MQLVKESPSSLKREIISRALSFIDTEYIRQGREPGVALDCGGVVICAGLEAPGAYMIDVKDRSYSNWPWVGSSFYRAFRDRMDEIPISDAGPGDVLMLCPIRSRTPQHCGVIVDDKFMVHTPFNIQKVKGQLRLPRVTRTRWTSSFWSSKIYAAFEYRAAGHPEPSHRVPSRHQDLEK